MTSQPVVHSAHNAVRKRDQGQKRNQHGSDVERKVQAISCPPRDRAQQVFLFLRFFLLFAHYDSSGCFWLLGFGHEHFRH